VTLLSATCARPPHVVPGRPAPARDAAAEPRPLKRLEPIPPKPTRPPDPTRDADVNGDEHWVA
jgi:hypothetical protein